MQIEIVGCIMAHIIWCGNKKWDSEFPEKPLPENAVRIERKANIFTGSLLYGIVPFLICLLIIYIKWHWLGTKTVYPALVPVGILIGLLLMPVHELLHAVCYCEGQTVYAWKSSRKSAFGWKLASRTYLRIVNALPIQHIAADGEQAQHTRRPAAELDGALRVRPEADGNDGVQITKLRMIDFAVRGSTCKFCTY